MASVALSSKAVGSIVKLNVGGVAKNFIVVHQGRPSSLYDTSCDGTWLLMEDCYESKRWHSSNVNDYANSEIRSYLNSTFLNLFDANIKSAIKQVKLPYRAGSGYGTTITSGANGLSTKIFLLSGPEVNWTSSTHSYIPNDGACLSYFSGCATTDAKRIAKLNGSAVVAPLSLLQLQLRRHARPARLHQWQLEPQLLPQLVWHPPRFGTSLFSLGL